jgi:hypothetical protein
MRPVNRKWRVLASVLLTGVVLRAFIPAGYMPAAPGQGLLLELCPSSLPAGFTSALADHEGHAGHHSAHDEHETDNDCSFGHILSFAFIDAAESPGVQLSPSAGIIAVAALELILPARVYAYTARGPPLP